MRSIAALCLAVALSAPVGAAERGVTFYLDGALVESEAVARKGYLEVPLPGNLLPGSLRMSPLGRSEITRVDLVPGKSDPQAEKEAAGLAERKHLLADRLKALEARESVFMAAAKSQSSKAPRKTKTNPEPLASIRKGTEFAITQLEEVYRARRKAEGELASVDSRLASLKRKGSIGGSVARVWTSEKEGRVKVAYLLSGIGWTPRYDFRVADDGTVEASVLAELPPGGWNRARVVLSTLAEALSPLSQSAAEGGTKVAGFRFPLEKEHVTPGVLPFLTFSFRNTSRLRLPPGEATCFRKGEYLGKARFDGCGPGESRELAFGVRE